MPHNSKQKTVEIMLNLNKEFEYVITLPIIENGRFMGRRLKCNRMMLDILDERGFLNVAETPKYKIRIANKKELEKMAKMTLDFVTFEKVKVRDEVEKDYIDAVRYVSGNMKSIEDKIKDNNLGIS